MLQDHLLSYLIFLPLLAALGVAVLPKKLHSYSRQIALAVSILQLILIVFLYLNFDAGQKEYLTTSFQFTERVNWITLDLQGLGKLSAEYFVGIDGLNVTLVLLSVLILLIGVIASWNIQDRVKGYFSLYLLLNASIIGCFVALDFLLFYLFFEFMLLPMYFLIGLWGGARREYASIKFFLYTLLGSILILVVMIGLYLSVIDPAATAVQIGLSDAGTPVSMEVIAKVQEMLKAGAIPDAQLVKTFNLIYMTDTANLIPASVMDTDVTRLLMGSPARLVAFLFLFVGFAIKVPVVPVHTWLPDAHVEAPTPISVILAGILLKIGGMVC